MNPDIKNIDFIYIGIKIRNLKEDYIENIIEQSEFICETGFCDIDTLYLPIRKIKEDTITYNILAELFKNLHLDNPFEKIRLDFYIGSLVLLERNLTLSNLKFKLFLPNKYFYKLEDGTVIAEKGTESRNEKSCFNTFCTLIPLFSRLINFSSLININSLTKIINDEILRNLKLRNDAETTPGKD